MFGLFSPKKRSQRLDDKVYISRQRADQVLLADLAAYKSANRSVFLVCFFDATLQRLQGAPETSGITAIKAEKIVNDLATRSVIKRESPVFLFAEHHPSFQVEDAVLNELEALCENSKPVIGFYVSLDEPMMKSFGSDNIVNLMRKLGMQEDEAISHGMVTKAIRNAQEKISKKVTTEIKCSSSEEWIRVNLPET